MDSNQEDIRFVETSPTDPLMPVPITWQTWTIIGVALLALMLLVWFIWRNRHQQPANAEDIHKKAHDEALAALALCPTEACTPTATECSLILRSYLATVSGDPALFETHEEWVSRHDALASFGEDTKQQVDELFNQLAKWKYAPAEDGDEPAMIVDRSRQLLETLNREVAA